MNADNPMEFLSAFICVHRRLYFLALCALGGLYRFRNQLAQLAFRIFLGLADFVQDHHRERRLKLVAGS